MAIASEGVLAAVQVFAPDGAFLGMIGRGSQRAGIRSGVNAAPPAGLVGPLSALDRRASIVAMVGTFYDAAVGARRPFMLQTRLKFCASTPRRQ